MVEQSSAARASEPRAPGAEGFTGGFTVLMAMYGRDDAVLFERALRSVFDNSLVPDDVVLVVDGPVPETLEDRISVLHHEHPLRVLRLPSNVGLARALNAGLQLVDTEWVVRADADDMNLPDRFQKQARAVHEAAGALDLVGGAILETDDAGQSLAVRAVPLTPADIVRRLPFRNPFNHMTVAFRTSLARTVGGYPELYLKEDYGLWAEMIAAGARCANLPDVLVHATTGRAMYRRRGGLRYARSELDLQRHLCSLGQKSAVAALATGCARASVALLPSSMRAWVYEMLLRQRPSASE